MKIFFSLLGLFIGMFVLSFSLQYIGLQQYSFFAPRYENVRRATFEQSKAYNQGMIQELQGWQEDYIRADKDHQAALASLIRHRAADYNKDNLPPDLYAFVESLPH